MQGPRAWRAAGGDVRTWRNESWLAEGDPVVFTNYSRYPDPTDQPQIWSYWGMQGLGLWGAAGGESWAASPSCSSPTSSARAAQHMRRCLDPADLQGI